MAGPSPTTDVASLLELDPELGTLLSPERLTRAREIRVRVSAFPVGEWQGGRLAEIDPAHIGLLLVDGVLAREVVLAGQVSTELLGSGDVLRPWHLEEAPRLLPVTVRWNALSTVRLALIDRRAAVQLASYPEISAAIVDRISDRSHRLAVSQAICQLNRVTERLMALFWHLAERWGRVGPDGVAVPLAMSHRLIGVLIGARRPSVSTALHELADAGQLVRRPDGTWLLTGEALSDEAAAEVVRQRRRLMPETEFEPMAIADPPLREHTDDSQMAVLRKAIDAARATALATGRDLETLRSETTALHERSAALRRARSRTAPPR
jgi:hypothetical protein